MSTDSSTTSASDPDRSGTEFPTDPIFISAHERTLNGNHYIYGHPAQRGEAYIAVMRDIAEAHHDIFLHEHHLEELVRIIRPFDAMNADDLNQVLEGIHDALLALFGELIVFPRRSTRCPDEGAHG